MQFEKMMQSGEETSPCFSYFWKNKCNGHGVIDLDNHFVMF
jgi:hypothetical protein